MAEQKPDLPISLNEMVIAKHYACDPRTREVIEDAEIEAMHAAMRCAREAAERALDARGKIMANLMRAPLANQREARKVTFQCFETAARQVDKARARAQAEIAALETATSSPGEPKNAADAFQREAIRNVLAAMSPEKRVATVGAAIEDDDRDVLIAAFTGPTMLTGLGKAEREALLDRWRRKHYPTEIDRMRRLRAAMGDLNRGGTLLLQFIGALTDGEAIQEAEEAEAAALTASEVA